MAKQPRTASAPGRVCLAGESLDWMIKGPSIVGAIELRTSISVSPHHSQNRDTFKLQTDLPYSVEKTIPLHQVTTYQNPNISHLQAALHILLKIGLPFEPVTISASSKLPIKAGVSSSAAASLATVAALSSYFEIGLSLPEICALAYQVEDKELRTGAGQMDFYACGHGGVAYLHCNTQPPQRQVCPSTPGIPIILIDTLCPHTTRAFISSKRQRWQNRDPLIVKYVNLVEAAVEHLRTLLPDFSNNLEEIGAYITNCHTYLRDYMHCSTSLLEASVAVCLKNGALGAKLTGSGMGGCLFALATKENVERVTHALKRLPVKIHTLNFSPYGVQLNNSAKNVDKDYQQE